MNDSCCKLYDLHLFCILSGQIATLVINSTKIAGELGLKYRVSFIATGNSNWKLANVL